MPDLDDLGGRQDTCVYIPFDPDGSEDDSADESGSMVENACLAAYERAWSRCLQRIQDIVSALEKPVVQGALDEVRQAYLQPLPGLPYVELPLVVVSGGLSSTLALTGRLSSGDFLDDGSPARLPTAYISQLHPAECGSIQNAMKALVSGFIAHSPSDDDDNRPRRRPAGSLAIYDMELLRAWYTAICSRHDEGEYPSLVVIMHNFEQFDPSVVQDLYHICSLHIPALPLVFLVSTSSPTPSAFIQASYSRATLALLRIRYFGIPSGLHVLDEILARTFFDPDWAPDVMIGPATLTFLLDHCRRNFASVDIISTILQLAHMKHFERPLAAFAQDELLGTDDADGAGRVLQTPAAFELLDGVLVRLHASAAARGADWRNLDIAALQASVAFARAGFAEKVRAMRRAFRLVYAVQAWMASQGHQGIDAAAAAGDLHPRLAMMKKAMDNTLGRDVKYFGMMISKLDAGKLLSLLDVFRACLDDGAVGDGDSEALADLERWQDELVLIHEEIADVLGDNENADLVERRPRDPRTTKIADNLRTLFVSFANARLVPLDSAALPLWDVWFMGSTPFPSELINPAPRSSILAALMHPHEYSRAVLGSHDADPERTRLWDLPDTSIVFRRYLDAGRMINVHDWFESFQQILDARREAARGDPAPDAAPEPDVDSPTGRAGRKVAVKQGREVSPTTSAAVSEEEEEEASRVEIQARFVRALHELDFLGFIKHTKRKADHIIKTVFELPDQ